MKGGLVGDRDADPGYQPDGKKRPR